MATSGYCTAITVQCTEVRVKICVGIAGEQDRIGTNKKGTAGFSGHPTIGREHKREETDWQEQKMRNR
jgi:hypothetical protein